MRFKLIVVALLFQYFDLEDFSIFLLSLITIKMPLTPEDSVRAVTLIDEGHSFRFVARVLAHNRYNCLSSCQTLSRATDLPQETRI